MNYKKARKIIRKLLKWAIMNLIFCLDLLLIKKEDIIIFFQSNDKYDDNAKILFKYMIENTNYQVYWLYENIQHEEYNFIKRYSLKGLWVFLKSKCIFITHGLGDSGIYSKNIKKTIQLWHSISFKNIGQLDHKNSKLDNYATRKESKKYDLFVVSSEIERYYIASVYSLKLEQVLVLGTPRNDYLLQEKVIFPKFLNIIYKDKKIILYAPTFRDKGDTIFFPFDDIVYEEIDSFLESENAIILLRPHPNDTKNNQFLSDIVTKYKNFIFARNIDIGDIAELSPFIDIVVTDYSSIYIDLLLKDVKPIFIPYDIENYKRIRGLSYDYELITPGSKVGSQKEFLIAIKNALSGAIEFVEKRKFVRNMFHTYKDGHSCKRIVQAMENLF